MKKLKWIICFISIVSFILVSVLIKNNLYIDKIVYDVVSKLITSNMTVFMKTITYLGSTSIISIITILVLILFKNKKYGLYMAFNLLFITIFKLTLKGIFLRERPIGINLITESGYSYPSGHMINAMMFYGFIIYLIYKSKFIKRNKIIIISLLSLLIFIIGFSRIYLGVHYFTDILGSITFSISYLIICTSLIKD